MWLANALAKLQRTHKSLRRSRKQSIALWQLQRSLDSRRDESRNRELRRELVEVKRAQGQDRVILQRAEPEVDVSGVGTSVWQGDVTRW